MDTIDIPDAQDQVVMFDAAAHGELVAAWWQAHGTDADFCLELLPPLGVVVVHGGEPVAALWCYEAPVRGGGSVGFYEHPVSRPGLTVAEAKSYFARALAVLDTVLGDMGGRAVVAYSTPGMRAFLAGLESGWNFREKPVYAGAKYLA